MNNNEGSGFVVQGISKLPLQVPLEILNAQKSLGATAVLVWINLLMFVQKHQAVNIAMISDIIGLEPQEVNKALARLADAGWINDEGYEIKLCIPIKETGNLKFEHAASSGTMVESVLDPSQRGFEWLIDFWSNRVAPPTQEEMKSLLFWVEKKRVSPEVIAVAVEEMSASIKNPHFAYLEGVLRNWVNEGVFTYAQLLEKPYLTKVLPQGQQPTIHPEAERKWKELFPDEFDS